MIRVPIQVAREVSLDCFCQSRRISPAGAVERNAFNVLAF